DAGVGFLRALGCDFAPDEGIAAEAVVRTSSSCEAGNKVRPFFAAASLMRDSAAKPLPAMLRAALMSAWASWPHSTHLKSDRLGRLSLLVWRHSAQVWLVHAPLTVTTASRP